MLCFTKLYINADIPEIAAFRQRYTEIDGYDPKNMTISLFSPVKKELTPEEFFQGAIKKMSFHCILFARIHKIHREHGWANLACKKCGRIAKEVDEAEAASIPRNNRRPTLWNCKVHKAITVVGIRAALDMIRDVSEQEIKDAIFSIGNDKSPGPDGFTAAFFKESWDIVANDVILAVREFFN
ncbi:hypothetical protein Tco_1570633 [Tanacetum coccineum]